jgi:tetratricopeptide (TPR) repeat protein
MIPFCSARAALGVIGPRPRRRWFAVASAASLLLFGAAPLPDSVAPLRAAHAQDASPLDASQNAPGQGQPARPPRASRPAAAARIPSDSGPLPAADLTPELVFQLLASEIAAQRGQTGSATATYLSLARKIRDPRLARRATELALAERSLDRALQAARLWHELAPAVADASQTLETLLLSTGRLEEARPLIARRLAAARAAGTLDDAYAQLQRALGRSPDKSAAFGFLEDLAAPDAGTVAARLALASQAQAAGMAERSAVEAGRALALRPDDEQLALVTAQLVQATPAGIPGALRVLEAFLGAHPRAVEVRFHYARLLAASGRADDARREMESALRLQPDSPAVLFALAQLAYQTGQADAAVGYLERVVGLSPEIPRDNATAYMLLSQIAEERRQLPQAIAWLERITDGDQALPALMRRALLIARSGSLDAARQLLRGTNAGSARQEAQLVGTEAQMLREAGRTAEAFALLDQALARQPANTELLYDHAMAAERLDRIDTMEDSLRRLIRARPDHAHAHNALGYSLADRGLRLEEAQALIERALQLQPDDPHILDSMGWVLYKRGQPEQALEYLRRAYNLLPDAEIATHLGEVLWKLGRLDEARKLWAEARSREPDNQTLRDTLARLNVAL